MTTPLRTELPRWLSSASVAWMGALLALLALALAAGFVAFERREIEQRELQSTELLARVIEDHANRSFDTIDITLSALAEWLRSSAGTGDSASFGPALLQAQQGMPFLRSLSVIDADGRVLASSSPGNIGTRIDPRRIPLPVAGRVDRLGSLVAGRDLADAAAGAASAGTRSFIPLVRRVFESAPAPIYLAAVLNPDFFANAHQLMLADASRGAALLGIDGTLLSATERIERRPGTRLVGHRFFSEYLPARESGSYIGAGIDGPSVVTALRVLRKRPIAVVVERDEASVQADMARTAGWAAAVCGMALAVIAAMAGMAWRSLRSHEAVQSALAAAHARVEHRERDLRSLIESVQELIFRTDAEGRINFVNGRWEGITGHTRGAALGRHLRELCLPAERPQVEALFDASATGPTEPQMLQILTRGGERRTLEVSVAAVRTADGMPSAYAGFAIDVSERQAARLTLQAQLDFSARLLEVSPTPLFVKDEHGRFTKVNKAWLDLMAVPAGAVIGRDSTQVFGDDGGVHTGHDERLLQSLEHVRYENRLLRPDGEQRDTVVSKVRFSHADGSLAGIVGSIIDVTEFREAERTTREARDAAERANNAKTAFIANISHELRTPLQAIIGFSEMGEVAADARPDLQEMFGDIHAGGRRMLVLVNGLLDVAKMDSTVGSMRLVRSDLAPLIAEVVRELRPLAGQRRLHIALAVQPERWFCLVDVFRFQQVLRNVLANSLRFAPPGTEIDIDAQGFGEAGVELTVRDHGPGIPAHELESIFEAFVQSSRTSDGSGGTGLGLTICRKIMGAHGGSIEAANAEGGGALMRIRLPAAAMSAAAPGATAGLATA